MKQVNFGLMKRLLIIACAFLFVSFSFSKGRVRKAFAALEVYNYFEAKNQFERSMKKYPVAASYGLSIIYGRNDNPFHNLDSALKYVRSAYQIYPDRDEKKKDFIAEFGVNDSTIMVQFHYVDSFAFEKAKEEHTVAAYDRFITEHYHALQCEEALQLRNQLAFEQVKIANTHDAFRTFIETYPEARQIPEAKALYEESFYLHKTSDGKLDSYLAFAESYPNSPYHRAAEDKIYEVSTQNGTVSELHNFVRSFPENPNVENAWRRIYNARVRSITPEVLAKFTIDFPDYPYMSELQQIFDLTITTFYPVESKGKWGFVNDRGRVTIPPVYDWVEDFNEGLALVSKGGLMGFIDKKGTVVVPLKYESAELFLGGLAVVAKDDIYGAVDRQGKVVVPFDFDELGDYTEDLTYAIRDEMVGYVNKKGRTFIDFQFEFGTAFKDGFAKVADSSLYGIIDLKGNIVVPLKNEYIDEFENGFARAREGQFYGLYNTSGKLVVPFEYDNIGKYQEGFIAAVQKQRVGFLNDTGGVVIDFQYNIDSRNIRDLVFIHGITKVFQKGKYGLIDKTGKKVLPAMFEDIGGWSDPRIAVKKNRLWGYVNRKNDLLIGYKFDYAADFENHLAVVKVKEKYGVIDTTGAYVVQPTFHLLQILDSTSYIAKNDSAWGVLTFANDTVLPFLYDRIEVVDDYVLQPKKGDFFGYFHRTKRNWIWRKD
jgi:tetratricopeptide (TPR) repeat protein